MIAEELDYDRAELNARWNQDIAKPILNKK